MRLRIGLVGISRDWQQRHYQHFACCKNASSCAVCTAPSSHWRWRGRASLVLRPAMVLRHDPREDIDAIMMLEGDWYGVAPLMAACEFGKAIYCGGEVDFEPQQASELKHAVNEWRRLHGRIPTPFCTSYLTTEGTDRNSPWTTQVAFLPSTLAREPRWQTQWTFTDRTSRPRARRNDRLVSLHRRQSCSRAPSSRTSWSAFDGRRIRLPSSQPDLSAPDEPPFSTLAQISCGAYMPAAWAEAITFAPPAAVQVCCEKGLAFVDLPSTLIWFDEAGRHQESLETEFAGRSAAFHAISPRSNKPRAQESRSKTSTAASLPSKWLAAAWKVASVSPSSRFFRENRHSSRKTATDRATPGHQYTCAA